MNRTVRAVRWHAAGDIRLDSVDVEEPGPDEVLVAVVYCGVCGSDIHEVSDGPHAIPIEIPHPLSGAIAPIVLGHEFSGVVSALGPGVEGLSIGDAVAVEPNYRCGHCSQCRLGRYHTCASFGFAGLMGNGGMAELTVLPRYMIHRLPDGFDMAAAAALEPAAVALHAVRRSAIRLGDAAAVVGLGPVGILIGCLLRFAGARNVTGIDPDPTRRNVALTMGFDRAVDPAAAESAAGVSVAFEVVGSQGAFETALACTRSGGEVVLVGLVDRLTLPAFDFVNDEKSIRASVGYNDCHPELIGLVSSGRLDLSPLVTRVVPLEVAPEVLMGMADAGTSGIKTLIRVKEER